MQSTNVTTGKVRFSYVEVWDAKAFNAGDEAKFSAVLLIPKHDTATVQAIHAAINAAIQTSGQTLVNAQGQLPPNLKMPLRDGDIERDNPEYAGHYFMSASSKRQPSVVDENIQPLLNRSAFYSGCYGRASINFYAFNNKGNKGIAVGLNAVQKLEDGQPLSGGPSVQEAFGTPTAGQFNNMPQQPYQQQAPQYNQQPQYQQPVPQQQYQAPQEQYAPQPQYQAQAPQQYPPAGFPDAPPAPTQWGNQPQPGQPQQAPTWQPPNTNYNPLG